MIVFDAEPLVAFYGDEPGSDSVEYYVVRADDERRADEFLSRIQNWFRVVDADDVWEEASFFKHQYSVALGDAFALATAQVHRGTAFVGADDDFDDVSEVPIERFRTEPA